MDPSAPNIEVTTDLRVEDLRELYYRTVLGKSKR